MADKGKQTDNSQQPDEYYPTPTSIPTGTRCLTIEIPDSAEWYGLAVGALWELMRIQNYEKVGLDIDLVVDRWLEVFRTMEVNCVNVPIGTTVMWLSDTIPAKWFELNGQAISKTTYPELFAIFGYTHGGGFDMFVLPSYRGRSPYGSGADIATQAVGGSAQAQININNLPPHNHPVIDPGHSHRVQKQSATVNAAVNTATPAARTDNTATPHITTDPATTGITTGNTGGGDGIPILHPVFGARMIIYAGR